MLEITTYLSEAWRLAKSSTMPSKLKSNKEMYDRHSKLPQYGIIDARFILNEKKDTTYGD